MVAFGEVGRKRQLKAVKSAGGATVCQKAMRREESLPTLIATPQIAPPIIHELRLSNDDSSGHRGVGAVKNAFENLRGRDFINDDGVAG